jgi:HK97 gp10 family phage protein
MGYSETGLKQMVEKMEAIRRYVRNEGRKAALRAGGRVVKVAMVERTPVLIEKSAGSTSLEPGAVKASIKVRMKQDGDQPICLIGPLSSKDEVGRAAYLVEYGHRMVTGGKSRLNAAGVFEGSGAAQQKDVPAHPFLRPAWEESNAAALDAIAETLKIGIEAGGQ